MAALDGAHLALGVKALLKRMPSRATRSKAGVLTQGQP